MISQKLFEKYAKSPAAFRENLIVDCDGLARRFGDVMDDWQKEDFLALDPGLMRCNGRSSKAASDGVKMRAFLERPRGHAKTSDLAVTCVWALAFATRPIRGYAFAADADQSRLLRDAIATIVRLNPWLAGILDVQKDSVINVAAEHPGKGGKLEIYTSDVGSSYGLLADIIICDELTHWEASADKLWHSLISTAAKRSALLVVISNAGYCGHWTHQVREAARLDEDWYFHRLDGPVASWMSPKRLAEQRRHLPAIAFARLWLNTWAASGGDALTPEDIAAAFFADLLPMTGNESGWQFVAGVDLGLVRDSSAVVVLAVPAGGRSGPIRLAHHRRWNPTPGRKVDLLEIERHILELDRQFGLELVALDAWQAEHLAQRLEADTEHKRRNQLKLRFGTEPWVRAIQPTGAVLRDTASRMVEYFSDRRLQLFSCEPLRSDLLKLRAEEKSYGIRFVSPRDETGHGDSASAFGLALLIAGEIGARKTVTAGGVTDVPENDGSGRPLSLMELVALRHEHRELSFQAEQAHLNRPEDHQEAFRKAMQEHNYRNPFSSF